MNLRLFVVVLLAVAVPAFAVAPQAQLLSPLTPAEATSLKGDLQSWVSRAKSTFRTVALSEASPRGAISREYAATQIELAKLHFEQAQVLETGLERVDFNNAVISGNFLLFDILIGMATELDEIVETFMLIQLAGGSWTLSESTTDSCTALTSDFVGIRKRLKSYILDLSLQADRKLGAIK